MSNSDEPMEVIQLHKKVVYWQKKYKELEDWIDVDERLPEKEALYNVICEFDDGTGLVHSLWFIDEKMWCFDSHGIPGEPIFRVSCYIDVLKWKPLPEPPKTKTK